MTALYRPRSVPEAIRAKAAGAGSHYYAGGLEVCFGLRTGTTTATSLVDVKRISALGGISLSGGQVCIGAVTRHAEIAANPVVAAQLPLLAHACGHLGNNRIRQQGTIGGNLAYGHPHSDPGTAALVYDATVELTGPAGLRQVPLGLFWHAPYQTERAPDELLTALRLQPLGAGWHVRHDRVELVHRPPMAICAVALQPADGKIAACRISVGGSIRAPLRLTALEAALTGTRLGGELTGVESTLAHAVEVSDDVLGSPATKLAVLAGLVRRTVGRIGKQIREAGEAEQ